MTPLIGRVSCSVDGTGTLTGPCSNLSFLNFKHVLTLLYCVFVVLQPNLTLNLNNFVSPAWLCGSSNCSVPVFRLIWMQIFRSCSQPFKNHVCRFGKRSAIYFIESRSITLLTSLSRASFFSCPVHFSLSRGPLLSLSWPQQEHD